MLYMTDVVLVVAYRKEGSWDIDKKSYLICSETLATVGRQV